MSNTTYNAGENDSCYTTHRREKIASDLDAVAVGKVGDGVGFGRAIEHRFWQVSSATSREPIVRMEANAPLATGRGEAVSRPTVVALQPRRARYALLGRGADARAAPEL